MKISVIIPTWNRADTIVRALHSVLQQTVKAHEIIVVDDGSDDDTAQRLAEFTGVTRLFQSNAGVSSARNRGIRAATGDWIALLDSDDEWLPEKLQRQSAAISEDPETRLCHCDEIWIRRNVRVNPKHKHQKSGGWIYRQCLPLCAISPSAALIRRDVFDTTGWFDESLPACEDYDYWLRFCAHYPVTYIDEPLLKKYGGHADQLSQRHWGMDRFRIVALTKAIYSEALSPADLQATQEMLATKLTIFTSGAKKRGRTDEARYFAERFLPATQSPLPPKPREQLSWHI